MIKGIGIDLVEMKRIEKQLNQERFLQRILTDKEKQLFLELPTDRRKLEFLAGRYAGKEACSKAFGTGIGKLSFQHIEILRNELGAPAITVKDYKQSKIFISISHSENYAIAQVVLTD
ncbi:holo-ACP synthase [Paracerasibacillus soli]|uniref:Holo-[acyl-carrier-protein] synthase n=1 Tax=Paracerasibacillus soli TaxID=480284 RepID=A0ABU5CVP0_9BACI|nr:holo-ACP synthase [Virgibacillus soli]MDY0410447.1 holo-ACP synthase [Virgibacillus soli]